MLCWSGNLLGLIVPCNRCNRQICYSEPRAQYHTRQTTPYSASSFWLAFIATELHWVTLKSRWHLICMRNRHPPPLSPPTPLHPVCFMHMMLDGVPFVTRVLMSRWHVINNVDLYERRLLPKHPSPRPLPPSSAHAAVLYVTPWCGMW